MDDATQPPKRRPRYKGTHPRRFEEKYKELAPDRYAEEQAKVQARGHTPAGTHRSIMVEEILEVLDPQPGERALDATLGYGGHTRELLPRLLPGGRVVGLDVDPLELPRTEARLRALGFGEDVLAVRRTNFAGLAKVAAEAGPFDLVLADLGVSSMQIDNPARGFTWKADGPLDLRLNPHKGRSAADFLDSLDEAALAELLVTNADESHAEAIARELAGRGLRTTRAVADRVRAAVGSADEDETKKALQRTFQALRIAVNDEFGALDQFLAHLPAALNPGGRAAILTFHSGEDRRVKKAFQEDLREGTYAAVAPDPLRASPEERRSNPRSTSAKLRWARRA
ncbi:16S rRNA (cytosine(1402)-N(4))-methyltransferase RsmH [Geothrix sp. 21YS21S-4]|uniref:16S rRNA (cytosine(1402)-N(4))-methyltransferase RsmH n=1 Tax=Geothrix sp. 21YS21S-4 TaxID=3068889 RepID=UPI0027B8BD38|nr:16S rRNA (cytosine(1402)-N(4))-methyltransferase RsmH [Geothrix sp. 21YS21S-4]